MFETILNVISTLAIPLIIVLIPLYGYRKGLKVYEVFTVGAKEGFDVALRIIPYLVAIFAAISIFRTSGAMQVLSWIMSPLTNLIGMPGDILPLAFMRPLSGSGALGILSELVKTHGPDSTIGRMASIMMGSTETTFYVLAVYFGSVSVTNSRHAVPAALTADLAGIISAVVLTNIIFG
ncbi:TPA: spore maturation protein [Candidatus Marinimicrobia bacterium]|nr:MAG: Nucleoside recognition domain protein [Marinimicrobia bacterium 46_43]HAE86954.1 spore maturation protein [Candidatus Neomarinimicrobiota bacterium]HBY18274.1 spore maturation protein [Candidatus Neomarinimicrobiota bacterium]